MTGIPTWYTGGPGVNLCQITEISTESFRNPLLLTARTLGQVGIDWPSGRRPRVSGDSALFRDGQKEDFLSDSLHTE